MINNKYWVALFSHTGSEIVNVSNKLGRWPDKIITNKEPGSDDIHPEIRDNVYVPDRPTVIDYREHIPEGAVVTLHGWMRIVPPEICKEYEIYNLHPGLISKYPELKGADPQKQVIENQRKVGIEFKEYEYVGCVIHAVSPGVDEGLQLAEASSVNTFHTVDTLSCHLHGMATDLWVEFLSIIDKKRHEL